MADRMNIKFTIQAVDRFSRVMDKLDRKLDAIRAKSEQFETAREVEMDADISAALRNLNTLQDKINRLEREAKKAKKVNVNTTEAMRNVEVLERGLATIGDTDTRNTERGLSRMERSLSAINDIDFGEAQRSIRMVGNTAHDVSTRGNYEVEFDFSPAVREAQRTRTYMGEIFASRPLMIEAPIEAETAEATSEISRWARLMNRLSRVRPDVDVDLSSLLSASAIIAAWRRMMNAPIVIKVRTELSQLRRTIGSVATISRNAGEALMFQFTSMATTFSTAVVPILAVTAANLANIGVMAGVAGGATFALASSFGLAGISAVAFGALAKGALKDVFAVQEDLNRLQEKYDLETDAEKRAEIMEEMRARTALLTAEQQKALKTMQALKSTWSGITSEMQPGVVNVFAGAVGGLTTMLNLLKPTFAGSVDAVQSLVDSLNQSLDAKDVRSFFTFLGTNAGPALVTIGKSVGNFMMGLFNMMNAFGPLSTDMQNGFLGMSERFRGWADSLSQSQGFQKFVNYVRENWPKVKKIFGDGIIGMVQMLSAFGGSASNFMDNLVDMMGRFREWSSTLSENQGFQKFVDYVVKNGPRVTEFMGAIIGVLVSLGVALSPIGEIALVAADKFLQFFQNINENYPIIAQIGGVIVSLVGFIGMLIIPLGLLRAGFSLLLPILKLAWSVFKGLMTPIASFFNWTSKLWPAITLLRTAFMMLAGPVGIVIGVLLLLVPVFMRLWNENEKFRLGVLAVWEWIKTAISTAITFISTVVMTVVGALVAWWTENQAMFLAVAKTVWDTVYNAILTAITWIYETVVSIASQISAFWQEHGGTIMAIAKVVWEAIKMTISQVMTVIKAVITVGLGIIQGIFQVVWPIISGIVKIAWALITNVIETAINVVMGIIDVVMSLIKGDWESAWDAILGICEDIWDGIVGIFEDIDLVQIGADIIQGLIDGISSMATAAWDAVSSIASGIGDAVMGVLDMHSPSRVFYQLGEYTVMGMRNGIESQASRTIDAVSRMAEDMTSAFNPTLDATASVSSGSYASGNAYSTASGTYAMANRDRAARDRQVIEVPVYIDGRKVADVTTDGVTRNQKRNEDVSQLFKGGVKR